MDSFKNRYLSSKYVDFWMADKGMEAGRNVWRQRLLSYLTYEPADAFRILDLGAGTGALSLEILCRYPNVSLTCLDFSEAMLSHARERLEKFKGKVAFIQSNLRNPGKTRSLNGTFNAVVSSFVTHTIPDKIQALYGELFRIRQFRWMFLVMRYFSSARTRFGAALP